MLVLKLLTLSVPCSGDGDVQSRGTGTGLGASRGGVGRTMLYKWGAHVEKPLPL
jgi:hypothetical protein